MRKYENFVFLEVSDLNVAMEEKWKEYEVISITKYYDDNIGDCFTAWLIKK